ncbi:hypothetical protein F4808DRAFT_276781 [Astrocystis sublimbata]|nr:hypothetical protein F4808DRAFT_276781 [Astrocystis sublimbata]
MQAPLFATDTLPTKYCLLGIFGVNLPLLYGERGEAAFSRLQEVILSKRSDPTLFGSFMTENRIMSLPIERPILAARSLISILAFGPEGFYGGDELQINPEWPCLIDDAAMGNNGTISVTVPVVNLRSATFATKVKITEPVVLALFGFRLRGWKCDTIGLILHRRGNNLYCRDNADTLAIRIPVPDRDFLMSHRKTIHIGQPSEKVLVARTELKISKKMFNLPTGFRLQTIVLVPPTSYDKRTRWLHNISERHDDIIFALVYCHPNGERFALLFAKSGGSLTVRPIGLDRTLEDSPESPKEDQSNGSQDATMATKIVRVLRYKLASFIQNLGGPWVMADDVYHYMFCPVVLNLEAGSKVEISTQKTNVRHSDDGRIVPYYISCSLVSRHAVSDWILSDSAEHEE